VIWAILAALGVPLWLCAAGIFMLLVNNRRLRKRYGDIPVRVRRPGKKRWTRGHAVWVSDVFAWRGSPAAWNEELLEVNGAIGRAGDAHERKKLHRLGEDPVIVTLTVVGGEPVEVAPARERDSALRGRFGTARETDADRNHVPLRTVSEARPI
jgi:hypothetical protein